MAIQNLTLYDFIVDLTPGIAAIFVFIPLFPPESLVAEMLFTGSLRFGVSLLILGYITGRLLHAISGSLMFEILQTSLDRLYLWTYAILISVILWVFPIRDTVVESLKNKLERRQKVRSVEERIKGDAKTRSQRVYLSARKEYHSPSSDLKRSHFKRFGESLLYGERGLYRKYEMLSTFFRNLAFLFSLASIVYLIYLHGVPYVYPVEGYVHESIWVANTMNPYPYRLAPYFFFILGFLCHTQRLKFEHRKNRAFVDDLYIKLTEDGPSELVENVEESVNEN